MLQLNASRATAPKAKAPAAHRRLVQTVSPAPAGETASDLSVHVVWSTPRAGQTDEIIELSSVLRAFKGFSDIARDRALFETVHVVDSGFAIAWDDGNEMHVDTLLRLAGEQMTNADFRAFLAEQRLTFDSAAAALGLSRRQIAYFAADKPIPRYIVLACNGFKAGLEQS
jgi:hypothetical protein